MSEINSLLPENATAHERALEMAIGSRISNIPVPVKSIWDPDTCPLPMLPFLAWSFGVDEWSDAWSEATKRATVRDAIQVQRRKGTVWAVKRVLENAGYPGVQIFEGIYGRRYDGSVNYDGFQQYGEPSQWANYRVVLNKPISFDQAEQVRRILLTTAPARCNLVEFVFTQAANLYDGSIRYDGTFSHGTV